MNVCFTSTHAERCHRDTEITGIHSETIWIQRVQYRGRTSGASSPHVRTLTLLQFPFVQVVLKFNIEEFNPCYERWQNHGAQETQTCFA